MGIIRKKVSNFSFTPRESVISKIKQNLFHLFEEIEVDIDGGKNTFIRVFPSAFLNELNASLGLPAEEDPSTDLLIRRGLFKVVFGLSEDVQAQILTEIIVSKIEVLDKANTLKDYLQDAIDRESRIKEQITSLPIDSEPGVYPDYLIDQFEDSL